jgi:DNA-binding response OmpR family regulator/two-component sensor histidine kinase
LLALINDLLDVSRIEAGAVELRFTPLNLTQLIGQVGTSLRPQINAKHQQLDIRLPQHLPAASGDASRVTQILTNLISNAHKYTPQGGTITVTAAQDGEQIRVDVQDNGIGMSQAEQEKLFTKFYRVHNRATKEVAGTGLGLAITRSLVEMHGGSISVRSEAERGATFSFTLPMTEGMPLAAGSDVHVSPGGVILVVDDDLDVVSLIRRYLERAGYEVLAAYNAADGLALAQAEQPDLITLDVLLPGTDGYALLEKLKSDALTASIPVMLLSILDDSGQGKMLGAIEHLSKPIDEHILLERIGVILSTERGRSVLVVDDDNDLRALIATNLRRAGYNVIEAASAAEAMTLARTAQPALVLIDIRMPDVSGVDLLRALRSDEATHTIPVMTMSASPDATQEHRSVIEALGATALMTKPYTIEELSGVLADGLRSATSTQT